MTGKISDISTSATTPADAAVMELEESSTSKKITWANIKAAIRAALGTPDFHPPDTSLFSMTNLGTSVTVDATYSAAKGLTVRRTDGGSSSADRLGFVGKAVPSGTWTAEMAFEWPALGGSNIYNRIGLTLVENGTGKWVQAKVGVDNSTTASIQVQYSTGLSSGTSSSGSAYVLNGPPTRVRFKCVYDGTNYTFTVSLDDGITYLTLATMAKATYFTTAADRIGIGLQSFTTFTANAFQARITYYSDPDFTV